MAVIGERTTPAMVAAMRKGSAEQQKSLLTAHPDLAGKLAGQPGKAERK